MADDYMGRAYNETRDGYECSVCTRCTHASHEGQCSYEAPPPEGGLWVRCSCQSYAKCGRTFESLAKANFHNCG